MFEMPKMCLTFPCEHFAKCRKYVWGLKAQKTKTHQDACGYRTIWGENENASKIISGVNRILNGRRDQ